MTGEQGRDEIEDLRRRLGELIESRNDLELERERYRELFETMPDGYVVTDPLGVMREVNTVAAELFEQPRDRLIGKSLGSMIEPSDRRAFYAQLARLHGQGPGSRLAINLMLRDGTPTPASLRATVAVPRTGDGTEIRWLLHDRRPVIVAGELRRSEERLRAMFDSAPVGIVLADGDGRVVFSNLYADALLGRVATQIAAGDWLSNVDPEVRARLERAMEEARGDGTSTTLRHRVQIGATERWVDHGIIGFAGGGDSLSGSLSTLIDATEEHRARLDLEASRDFTDAILDTVGALVIVVSPQGRIERFNAACEAISGFSAGEMIGRPLLETLIPEDEREAIQGVFAELAGHGTPSRWENDWVTAGGDRRTITWTNSALCNPDGSVRVVIGTGIDVTETRVLEARLAQADRLESIGRLAAGIAHDFSNTLSTIRLRLDRIARRPLDDDTRSDLAAADATIDRTRRVIGDLISFSRRQRLKLEPTDLNAEIRRITDLLADLVPDSVAMKLDLTPVAAVATVDSVGFDQALTNLVINACDAMPDGGVITVTTAIERFDADSAPPGSRLTPGTYVCVCVTDTGTGIDPSDEPHVFEPYFTTKPPSKGTGLGLATTHGTIVQSGGAIVVDSTPGRGTTFTLWLPQAHGEVSVPSGSPGPAVARAPISSPGVIVVDDDPDMREALASELERLGYRTLTAPTAEDALAYVDADVDLLISDVQLPGIDGVELAGRFRAERPGLAVLFVSGASPSTLASLLPDGATALHKPFTSEQLAAAVDAAAIPMAPPSVLG